MRRLLLPFVLVALASVLLPGRALAGEVTPAEGVGELTQARELVDRSLDLYGAGETEEAYRAARDSYLEHFEQVEIPLRVRDEALTLSVEEDYARFRNSIRAGAPLSEVEDAALAVRNGLDDVERTLAEPGLAAPLLAFGYAFTVLFREGLEAVLIVAAILGYLEASRNTRYKGAILKGVAGAGAATVVTFVVATLVIQLGPLHRELIEAVTALLAVVMLFYVSFWLITRLEHRRWMEFVKAKVWTATATGSTLALVGVGFTAVYREGFETVLFYQALLSFARGLWVFVAGGTLLAAVALGGVGWFIFKAGKRLPIKAFLGTAVAMVMVLSVAFAGNAVRGFQEAALVPVNLIEGLPHLPIFLSQLTGWYPTRETLLAQGSLAIVYVLGALWTFVYLPRRERRLASVRVAAAERRVEEPQEATTGS